MGGDENGRTSPPGVYTELFENEKRRMSDDVFLLRRDREFVSRAHGDVLLTGLGLGLTARWLCNNCQVRKIDVVEISQDVIDLVAPHLPDKVHVIRADAYRFEPEQFYDFVLHRTFF